MMGSNTMMLYGNVIPRAEVIYKLGFACGIVCRKTAGAAINEALARSNPNITEPPTLKPRMVATNTPMIPLNVGIIIANDVKNKPTSRMSPNR